MKVQIPFQRRCQTGGALALTLVMTGVALSILGGVMAWSATSTRLTHRSIQYNRSLAAAEGATEKVVGQIIRDYLDGGEKRVVDNEDVYRRSVLTGAESANWDEWKFNNSNGQSGWTTVQSGGASNYVVLNSAYAGLKGYVSRYTVVSHARQTGVLEDVSAGVLQEVELARIPIFQFAMYSSSDMEISCGQPFTVTGRVHSNKRLFIEPDDLLTFQSDVTAVRNIDFSRHPDDTRSDPNGGVVYEGRKDSNVAALSLPIATNNTEEAIRELIQPPPSGEDPNSALGRLRYYNQADVILTVSDSGMSVTSKKLSSLVSIPIPENQLTGWVSTSNSFWDAREEKTVESIDINVGALASWSQTNLSLTTALGIKGLSSVYVEDNRTLAGSQLGAVRVYNGRTLPSSGLTVATARPLYVLGHYNQADSSYLGTTNTTTTKPASLVADAITILSPNWTDANSANSLDSRVAAPDTVNAAILTGVVETSNGNYSGGMENFPRFLEKWGAGNPFTYNGSMVKMFSSEYATNIWGLSGVYEPPKRDWTFDSNFYNPAKLPPLTPSLQKVFRSGWSTVASNP